MNSNEIDVTMVVDGDQASTVDTILANLQSLGVRVKTSIPEAGIVMATAPMGNLPEIQKSPGVLEARPAGNFQLPIMSEDVPQ